MLSTDSHSVVDPIENDHGQIGNTHIQRSQIQLPQLQHPEKTIGIPGSRETTTSPMVISSTPHITKDQDTERQVEGANCAKRPRPIDSNLLPNTTLSQLPSSPTMSPTSSSSQQPSIPPFITTTFPNPSISPHPFKYRRTPIYASGWYEEVVALRGGLGDSPATAAVAVAGAAAVDDKSIDEVKANQQVTKNTIDAARPFLPAEKADLLADWQYSRGVLVSNASGHGDGGGGGGGGQVSESYSGSWPCDLKKVKGLRVDGRVPMLCIGKKVRDAVGEVQRGEGTEKRKNLEDVESGMFDFQPQPPVPDLPAYIDYTPYSAHLSVCSSSTTGLGAPTPSDPTPQLDEPTIFPFILGPTADDRAYASAVYGDTLMSAAASAVEGYMADFSTEFESDQTTATTMGLRWLEGEKGKGKDLEGETELMLADLERLHGSWDRDIDDYAARGWSTGMYDGKETEMMQILDEDDDDDRLPHFSSTSIKTYTSSSEGSALASERKAMVTATATASMQTNDAVDQKPDLRQLPPFLFPSPTAAAAAAAAAATATTTTTARTSTRQQRRVSHSNCAPPPPPSDIANRKRKSTSIVEEEVTTAARKENRVMTKAEIEAEIARKRKEGNAAAAKKCRENQKARYEKLSRENLALIRQLQASDLINSKLSVQVQRLQYENMMIKKQRFSEFTRETQPLVLTRQQDVKAEEWLKNP